MLAPRSANAKHSSIPGNSQGIRNLPGSPSFLGNLFKMTAEQCSCIGVELAGVHWKFEPLQCKSMGSNGVVNGSGPTVVGRVRVSSVLPGSVPDHEVEAVLAVYKLSQISVRFRHLIIQFVCFDLHALTLVLEVILHVSHDSIISLDVVVKIVLGDTVCLRNGGLISWRLINLGSMKLILTEIGLVKISTSVLVEIALPVLVKVIPPIEIVSIISLRVLNGWKTWRSNMICNHLRSEIGAYLVVISCQRLVQEWELEQMLGSSCLEAMARHIL
ncbi:hypothetical protein Tco_1218775 [Tanacetum coccineum]